MTIIELEAYCKENDIAPVDLNKVVSMLSQDDEAKMVNLSGYEYQLPFILTRLGSIRTIAWLREIRHAHR